jgi:hypothetical protein
MTTIYAAIQSQRSIRELALVALAVVVMIAWWAMLLLC